MRIDGSRMGKTIELRRIYIGIHIARSFERNKWNELDEMEVKHGNQPEYNAINGYGNSKQAK